MTTTILRPDGVVSASGSISITGAASIDAALNDSSDASYIQASLDTQSATLHMQTVALPAGAVTSSVTVTFRDDSVSTASRARLSSGATILDVNGSLSLASVTSANYPVTLSQAQVDALQVTITLWNLGSRAYDVFASLTYATQPTTAVSAPTGVQTTSTPTVAWSHTAGSDGGTQFRYHARIFSAAEYGVGGFNPETSPATWDSVEQASDVATTTSGVLANSTTYRCYVRTAQNINGAAHWAEWAFSSFTTSFTTPDITSVAVTADSANARHRITVTRNTGTPNWLTFDVERSDDASVTWAPVRGATGATPPGDVWIGYDYEGTNGTQAIYRARAATVTVVGPWATSSGATWTSADHWLKDLRSPGHNVTAEISAMPQRSFGIEQSVHRVLGRADPVVVSDVRQMHTASVTYEVYTAAEADNLRDLLSSGTVLMQIGTGLGYDNIYLVAGSIVDHHAAEQIGTDWRYVEVSYTAVAAPADDGVDATGLTWDDVDGSYADWQALLDTGMTWGDLV